MESAVKTQRSHNRLNAVRDAGAKLFATRGYKATTMRDIAAESGMKAGSLYYHFASKQELLHDIYEIAVTQALEKLEQAISQGTDPRSRFEAAVISHVETMLDQDNYARVMTGVLPVDAPEIGEELVRLRDLYEARFRTLVDELPLQDGLDRRMFRLFVLGAINDTRTWYRQGGKSPEEIGRQFVRFLQPVVTA